MLFAAHIFSILALAIILAAPLPLASALLFQFRSRKQAFSPAEEILRLLLIWCVIQSAIAITLSLIGHLGLAELLAVELILLTGGLFVSKKVHTQPNYCLIFRLREMLTNWESEKLLIFCGLLSVFFVMLWRMATEPIVNSDSLIYHLPAIASWISSSSLQMPHVYPLYDGYPYNWEMLAALFVLPFNNDILVCLPNLIALAILLLSVYLLAMRMGADQLHSMVAASLVGMYPVIFDHTNTMHIDLPFAAFFVAGFFFVYDFHLSRSRGKLVFALLSLAYLAGIKSSGPVYAALPFAFLLIKEILRFARRQQTLEFYSDSFRSRPALLLAFFLSVFTAGFWYIRNTIAYGNPLGAVKIKLLDRTLFDGVVDTSFIYKTTLAHVFRYGEFADWYTFAHGIASHFQLPLIFVSLGVFSLLIVIVKRGAKNTRSGILEIITLMLVCWILYWWTPYSGDNGSNGWRISPWVGSTLRYTFAFFALAAALAARGAYEFSRGPLAALAAVGLSGVLVLERSGFLALGMTIFILLMLAILYLRKAHASDTNLRHLKALSPLLLLILLSTTTLAASEVRDRNRLKAYGQTYTVIEQHSKSGEKIGYLEVPLPYTLFGENLDRRAIHLVKNHKSPNEFAEDICKQKIKLIAIGPHNGQKPQRPELKWLDDKRFFKMVYCEQPETEPCFYRPTGVR